MIPLQIAFLVIAWLSSVGVAALSKSPDGSLTRLAKVDLFAFGGIGIAGVTSQGEEDYRAIAARSSAEADFNKVYAVGTPEAKCYALVSLHQLNDAKFKSLWWSLRSSKVQVSIMNGCLMRRTTLGAMVEQIRAGKYKT